MYLKTTHVAKETITFCADTGRLAELKCFGIISWEWGTAIINVFMANARMTRTVDLINCTMEDISFEWVRIR